MKTSDLDYDLPENLIARHPSERREDARLLHLDRGRSILSHRIFRDLPDILRPGDLLVLNDSRVFPARLLGQRYPEGGQVEAFLLHCLEPGLWTALVKPGKRIRGGDRLVFAPQRLEAVVESYGPQGGGERTLRFDYSEDWWDLIDAFGHVPLPPYIVQARKMAGESLESATADPDDAMNDRERYQTIYAGAERGSVAAPTAGLHFSQGVFEALDRRDIDRVFLQLHVGAGTFQPIKTDAVESHPMHEEFFRISADSANRINAARRAGQRIVAVGTTVVRALETAALAGTEEGRGVFRPDSAFERQSPDMLPPVSGWSRLMIAPGFAFQVVDALITNFHLPRSSLLLLVGALAGLDRIKRAYAEAIERDYRFYSYGDCMLID